MSDFLPPSGPPPPSVPAGWKAVWNAEYKEWFYVNTYTKQSQWDKPTHAVYPDSHGDNAPSGIPPPGYTAGNDSSRYAAGSDLKKPFDSNNPYGSSSGPNQGSGYSGGHETDEEMARRLQREEAARHSRPGQGEKDRGQADTYYETAHGGNPSNYGSSNAYGGGGQYGGGGNQYGSHSPQPQPPGISGGYPGGPQSNSSAIDAASRGSSGGGLFGKLKQKLAAPGSSGGPPGYGHQQQGGYGQSHGGYPSQPQGYGMGQGGYPPQQQYGGYPQGGYGQQGGYGMAGAGGYGGQFAAQQQAKKKHGMGAGGAAALGVGGGLLGGMLLADAIDDHDDNEYQQGYDDGGDAGGGDDFGGDF